MRNLLRCLAGATMLFVAVNASALMGELKDPGVALPESFPKSSAEKLKKALHREDCKFLGGMFLNWFTTLRYGGDTRALNLFLEELSRIPGVTFRVSFVKTLVSEGSFHVHHDGMDGKFHIRVSLEAENIKVEDVVIPEVHGQADPEAAKP